MEPEKKSNGATMGLIIIVIILVLGGIYIWMSGRNEKLEITPAGEVQDQDAAALEALEQELNTTETEVGVDAETIE